MAGPTSFLRAVLMDAGLLIAGLLLAAACVTPAAAQSDPAAEATEQPVSSVPDSFTATFADWLLRCQRAADPAVVARVCDVVSFVVPEGQAQPFAQLTVTRRPGEGFHLTLLVPVNVSLGGAPVVATDEADAGMTVPWIACTPSGCIADVALGDADLQRYRAYAKQGRLTFFDSVGNQVRVLFSFRGLAQALDAMALETIAK